MNLKSELIYLASPYSHSSARTRDNRFNLACHATGYLIASGMLVFSPIVHTHPVANCYELPLDFNYWAQLDCLMISKCDVVYLLQIDGWRESKGVRAEIEYALNKGMPIHRMIRQVSGYYIEKAEGDIYEY